MSDHAPRAGERTGRGFSTRAIAAASRAPRLDQTPTSVPINQTATFAWADADGLGAVAGDRRAGYAYTAASALIRVRSTSSQTLLPAGEFGGRAAGKAVIEAMSLPESTASLGRAHTLVVHPPSTSQRHLTDAELADAGITPGLLRVSVGLEDPEDLQADVAAALEAARRVASAPAVA